MRQLKLGVALVVQNDEETIVQSLESYYSHVSHIVVSTDPKHGWSGAPITPDSSLQKIRDFDSASKIDIFEGAFSHDSDPMQNDTLQRRNTDSILCARKPDLDWVLTPDADEVFLDIHQFLYRLSQLKPHIRLVIWEFIVLFKRMDDGHFLVVTDESGTPHMDNLPLAHRPGELLVESRKTMAPRKLLFSKPYSYESTRADVPLLHYSWAKSARRIQEKLKTWGHSKEFDTEKFFRLWEQADQNWDKLRNFHPLCPTAWPRLKPFTIQDLTDWAKSRNRDLH